MKEVIALKQENLTRLAPIVSTPSYDRTKIKTGIVHVGIGGFHRAHQALYTDELLAHKENHNWGICGIALLPFDDVIYKVLQNQDGLYTLIVKELDGSVTTKVIGSIVEYLFAPENPDAVIKKMANPDIKIITLTITEGGYNYNEATGEFDFKNQLIQHDLENSNNPKTIFGYLTQALKLRKEKGYLGLTVQSCDNIQGNGNVAKKMLLSYIEVAEPQILNWVKNNVTFPNSMVDRITPVTSTLDISDLKESSGIEDEWPVVCEPFRQWVIEDDFIAGRPVLENVGAQFVKDVAPYERMKLSLLNAGHSILGILGALLGFSTIDEAVNNEAISSFLRTYMDTAVTPTLDDLKGVNLKEYKNSLIERFGNINIKDQIDRICSQSSAKIPIFILPTIKAQLKEGGVIHHAAFLIAAWAIYSLGKDEKGNVLNVIDAMKDILNAKAVEAKQNPTVFLEIDSVFADLKNSKVFVDSYTKAYHNIMKDGIHKCLTENNSNMLNTI